MSKLSQVKKALLGNPEIIVIATKEINYLPGENGFFSHTVDFFVAPKVGTLSTAEELQTLMMSLVPEIKPTSVDNFDDRGDDKMSLGKLYFDEYIGTRNIEIVLTDEDMFSIKGCFDGKIEQSTKIERRVWVRLYPNIQAAKSAERGIDQYSISKKKLRPRKQGFFTIFFD